MSSKRNSYSYIYCVFCRVCVCIITINVYLGNCPCTFIRIQDALYLSPSLSLYTHTNIYCCVFWLVLTCKPVHLSCLLPPILMTTTGYLYPLPNTLNTFVLSFIYAILHHHTYIHMYMRICSICQMFYRTLQYTTATTTTTNTVLLVKEDITRTDNPGTKEQRVKCLNMFMKPFRKYVCIKLEGGYIKRFRMWEVVHIFGPSMLLFAACGVFGIPCMRIHILTSVLIQFAYISS